MSRKAVLRVGFAALALSVFGVGCGGYVPSGGPNTPAAAPVGGGTSEAGATDTEKPASADEKKKDGSNSR